MWEAIKSRGTGRIRTNSFANRFKSRRILSLQLSNRKDFVSPHRGSVNSLQLAEYFEKVVATDINELQLKRAVKHERISYHHTPTTMSEDQMVALIGGDNSVDLIVAAQAVHYFDLSYFYNIAKRVLRKKGGLIAVWVYNDLIISPEVDSHMKRLVDSTFPYRTPIMNLAFYGYKTLPFPFEGVKGMGSEGKPITLDIPHKLSLKGFIGFLRSWQPAMKAKERGVELVTEDLINKFEEAWGDDDDDDVKDIFYKGHMIVGKLSDSDVERYRQRFESNCVVTKLKDSNNSAVIASVTAAAFAGVAAYCLCLLCQEEHLDPLMTNYYIVINTDENELFILEKKGSSRMDESKFTFFKICNNVFLYIKSITKYA